MLTTTDQKIRFAFAAGIVWFFAGLWAMSVMATWGAIRPSSLTGEVCPVVYLRFGSTTGIAASSVSPPVHYLAGAMCGYYYALILPITLLLVAGIFLLIKLLFRKTGLIK